MAQQQAEELTMRDKTRGLIEHCRKVVSEYNEALPIPEEEFPGAKSLYMLNLSSSLGRYVPALCNELDAAIARLEAAERVVAAVRQQTPQFAWDQFRRDPSLLDGMKPAERRIIEAVLAYAALTHPAPSSEGPKFTANCPCNGCDGSCQEYEDAMHGRMES